MMSAEEKRPVGIVICGFGEIATNAHLPSIQQFDDKFRLVAIVEPNRKAATHRLASLSLPQVPVFSTLSECLKDKTIADELAAVAVCTPATVTLDLAAEALQAGKHVLVEKPPGDWKRLSGLQDLAQQKHVAFFTAYHTAACIGLPHAKSWLLAQSSTLEKVHVTWKENVRKWHPGQVWVTMKSPTTISGCEGVLDMVFNPLSLLFALFGAMEVESSRLEVPSNWETPISGSFNLSANANFGQQKKKKQVPVTGEFSWKYEHAEGEPEEIWTIDFYSATSTLSLKEGGCQVYANGARATTKPTPAYPLETEYQNLYKTFAALVADKASAVDDTTPRLLQEIQDKATLSTTDEYKL